MGRKRIYSTPADRQKAYRERAAARTESPPLAVPAKKPRPPSRPARLAEVEKQVRLLADEYESWLDGIPDSLCDSHTAELLTEAIDQLNSAADMIAEITLPLGFGRD